MPENINLDWFVAQYGHFLEQRAIPIDEKERHHRTVAELEVLADLSDALSIIVDNEPNSLKTQSDLLSSVRRAASFVPVRVREIYESYTLQGTIISDTDFEQLSAPSSREGASLLDRLATTIATIDQSYFTIASHRAQEEQRRGSKEHKKKLRADEFDPNALRAIRELNGLFSKGVRIADHRDKIVEQIILKNIIDTRNLYVLTRDRLRQAVSDFDTNVGLFAETDTSEGLYQLLADWDVPTVYAELQRTLETEQLLLPDERRRFQQQIATSRETLSAVMPSRLDQIYQELKCEATSIPHRLETIFMGREPNEALETKLLDAFSNMERIWTTLSSDSLRSFLDMENTPRVPPAVRHAIEIAKAHISHYRLEKGRLKEMAEVARHEMDALNDTAIRRYAATYQAIYGAHSWRNRRSYGGAFKTTEQMRQDFFTALNTQMSASAEKIRMAFSEVITGGGTPSKSLVDEVSKLQRYIAFVREEKSSLELGRVLRSSTALSDLEAAIADPADALKLRNELMLLSSARLEGTDALVEDIDRLFATYVARVGQISATIDGIAVDAPFRDLIVGVGRKAITNLTDKLSMRVRTLLSYSWPDDDNLRELSGSKIERNLETLRSLKEHQGMLVEDVGFLDLLDHHFTAYEQEASRRNGRGYRLGQWFKRMVTGNSGESYYVLDTNVLIHKPDALRTFKGKGVVLLNEVIWEIDKKKREQGNVAESARAASRDIRDITERVEFEKEDDARRPHPFGTGAIAYNLSADGSGSSIITFDQDRRFRDRAVAGGPGSRAALRFMAWTDSKRNVMDEAIIQAALGFKKRTQTLFGRGPEVIFVSRDGNARLAARAAGLPAEDYRHDQVVRDTEGMYTGYRYMILPTTLQEQIRSGDLSEGLMASILELAVDTKNLKDHPLETRHWPMRENEFVFWRNPDVYEEAMALRFVNGSLQPLQFLPEEGRCFPLIYFAKHPEAGLVHGAVIPKNMKQLAALELLLDPAVEVVSIAGKAGSGKTFLAIAASLHMRLNQSERYPYQQIVLTKPLISLGQGMGFRKGDDEEKLAPWYQPLYAHIENVLAGDSSLRASLIPCVQAMPIEYLRGMDVKLAMRILDEAQNLTPHEVLTFLTRHCEPAKTIVLGDPNQIDNRFLDRFSNGYTHLRLGFVGEPVFGHITFNKGVRGLVAELAERRIPYQGGN